MVTVGEHYNSWEVLEIIDDKKCLARCECGTVKEVTIYNLEHDRSKCCGCKRNRSESIEGKTFGEWKVLKDLHNRKCLCECSCGTIKEVNKGNLVDGFSMSCGHLRRLNVTGQKFNSWKVLKELGYGKVLCECDCGTVRELYKKAVVNGETKSCGCKGSGRIRIEGQTFGEWHVDKYLGDLLYECTCSCGTKRKIRRPVLISGRSKSCGCKQGENLKKTMKDVYGETCSAKITNPREAWQIEAVETRENMLEMLDNLGFKPTVNELTEVLGINASSVLLKVHKHNLEDYVDLGNGSKFEDELLKSIKEMTDKEVLRHNRNVINPYELDIYIPELNLAVEFNGDYWHSSDFKEIKYHQNKTLACADKGIRLISVFEYEWRDDARRPKILSYLKSVISGTDTIYARDTKVIELTSLMAYAFEDANHLQGRASSSINLGLTYKDEIIGVMTFGAPRFNNDCQYELLRLCFKSDIRVIGGAEKLFKYFIEKYNPDSIISYCDLSKFTGRVYSKLGFEYEEVTKPNYVWVDTCVNKYYTRYQTQKSNLIKNGLGSEDETEDQIMRNLQCVKVYDCGNLKFKWNNKKKGGM